MTSAERKAVGFFAALAAAGAAARVIGLGDPPGARPPSAADRLALQQQLEAVDSAHAHKARGRAGQHADRARGARGGRGSRRRSADTVPESVAALPGRPADPLPGRSAATPRGRASDPVDVNVADSAALEALPGVGPALARRIVADRAAQGPYASMAELSRVPGIGTGMERRLAAWVRFGGVTFPPRGRPASGSVSAAAGARVRAPVGWPPP